MAEKTCSEEASIAPTGIDHLVYACANLEHGMDEIEALLGVRPVRGGHHPQYGTHTHNCRWDQAFISRLSLATLNCRHRSAVHM